MRTQAKPTLIGGFVVGAIGLLVLGLLVFGSGRYFRDAIQYVMYFDGSVNGLDVGAPVKYQGVKIGTVSGIELQLDRRDRTVRIPVIIDVAAKFANVFNPDESLAPRELVNDLIERGLRAQLKEQSLVTGKLMIELEYDPDTPIRLVGGHADLPEIPTAPSGLAQITQKVQDGLATANELPIRDVFARLLGVLEAMERLLSSEDLAQGLNAGRRAVDEVGALAHRAAGRVDPLAESLELTLVELRSTLRDTRRIIGALEPEVAPMADDIRSTLGSIREAARQAQGAFSNMEDLVSEGSPLAYKLDRVLDELIVAVRSLRVTSDYLQQNPNAIWYGKRPMGGN